MIIAGEYDIVAGPSRERLFDSVRLRFELQNPLADFTLRRHVSEEVFRDECVGVYIHTLGFAMAPGEDQGHVWIVWGNDESGSLAFEFTYNTKTSLTIKGKARVQYRAH